MWPPKEYFSVSLKTICEVLDPFPDKTNKPQGNKPMTSKTLQKKQQCWIRLCLPAIGALPLVPAPTSPAKWHSHMSAISKDILWTVKSTQTLQKAYEMIKPRRDLTYFKKEAMQWPRKIRSAHNHKPPRKCKFTATYIPLPTRNQKRERLAI